MGHWHTRALCRRGFDLRLRRSVPAPANGDGYAHAYSDGCSDSSIHPNVDAYPQTVFHAYPDARRAYSSPHFYPGSYARTDSVPHTAAAAHTCIDAYPYPDANTPTCAYPDADSPTYPNAGAFSYPNA